MNSISALIISFSIVISTASAQSPNSEDAVPANEIARVIGVEELLRQCAEARCAILDPASATLPQLVLRQQISDAVLAASLDVDAVLVEIDNEYAQLLETRSVLQGKRDRVANLLSAGNIVLGSGLGILVNALQFKDSTATLGDAIGVGSGGIATALSIAAFKFQGPRAPILRSPNMLAPLFDREPVLRANYPPAVLAFLNSSPPGMPPSAGTRLEQLRREWAKAGRLGGKDATASQKKIDRLTAGLNASLKLSIGDITDRAYMLRDVAARVSLMKRELAALLAAVIQSSPQDRRLQ